MSVTIQKVFSKGAIFCLAAIQSSQRLRENRNKDKRRADHLTLLALQMCTIALKFTCHPQCMHCARSTYKDQCPRPADIACFTRVVVCAICPIGIATSSSNCSLSTKHFDEPVNKPIILLRGLLS